MNPQGPTTSWSSRRARAFPPRTARRILQRYPTCALGYPGCTITSTQADHTVGHADALAAGWEIEDIDAEENGQGVCTSCHNIKTRAEQARGRARRKQKRQAKRQAKQHPGIRN